MTQVVKIDGSDFNSSIGGIELQPLREDTVIFENNGELDIRAIKIMGISAKDNKSAIGYFGTGLKYAIAVLVREGLDVVVYSGETEYKFEKKDILFRNQKFITITMNGEELPFTTELGKNWKLWQAFRELYCNTTDEHGEIYEAFSKKKGVKGKTIICVSGAEFKEVYDNRRTVILDTPKWLSNNEVEIHKGRSTNIFYRGIKVMDIRESLYTYNITKQMTLTEDRTLMYSWHARIVVMNFVLESTNTDFIKSVLLAPEYKYENTFDFTDQSEATATPSKEFLAVAESLEVKKEGGNRTAFALAKNYRHKDSGGKLRPEKLTEIRQVQLDRAIKFCTKIGFPVANYPIVVTPMLGQSVLGLAEDSTIYLNPRLFNIGVNKLVAVLIEEYVHLKYEFKDESREMQTYLFEKIVELGAEFHKEAL